MLEHLIHDVRNLVKVKYPTTTIHLGTELSPKEAENAPEISWDGKEDTYYTLLMLDACKSKYGPVNHWLIGNIVGNNLSSGRVITEYLGPGPRKDSGLHKYFFVVFEQPYRLEYYMPHTPKWSRPERINFPVESFAYNYHQTPIAVNFFTSQWDEYVDERDKNFDDGFQYSS